MLKQREHKKVNMFTKKNINNFLKIGDNKSIYEMTYFLPLKYFDKLIAHSNKKL